MYRKQLPRVYEIRDMAQSPPSAEAYFSDFDNKLTESPVRLKHFRDIEAELQGLDASAWSYLKAQLAPLLAGRSEKRGWQALFDKLNEAKGYNHLISVGCTNVEFIPVSSVNGLRHRQSRRVGTSSNGRAPRERDQAAEVSMRPVLRSGAAPGGRPPAASAPS
jgi:hypothetical protein